MFDSLLDRSAISAGRLRTGAAISVLGHAAILGLALSVPDPLEELPSASGLISWPDIVMTTMPASSVGGPAPKRRTGPALQLEPRRSQVVGKRVGHQPRAPAAAAPSDAPSNAPSDAPSDEGPGGGGPGPDLGGSCGGATCPLLPNMVAPILMDRGRDPQYTREALEARVQGLMTLSCVVTVEGRVDECRTLRSLPPMERPVVEALMTRRYLPATFDGRPIAVRYDFAVRLVLPR